MNSIAALVVATCILVLIPGPNAALIVANSLRYGFRMGVMTVLGTTAGVAMQLILVVAGLAAVIELAADLLIWIRWAGVFYLIWLGVRIWREPATDLEKMAAAPALFWRGCMLAAVNPKTLLFNAAFIPQFAGDESGAHFGLLAGVFLGVLFSGDVAWALFASSARKFIGSAARWRNRVTGAFLTAAGVGLALARR